MSAKGAKKKNGGEYFLSVYSIDSWLKIGQPWLYCIVHKMWVTINQCGGLTVWPPTSDSSVGRKPEIEIHIFQFQMLVWKTSKHDARGPGSNADLGNVNIDTMQVRINQQIWSYLLDCFLVDERSLGGAWSGSIPHSQFLLHRSSKLLHKFIVNTLMYVKPVCTHTGLK